MNWRDHDGPHKRMAELEAEIERLRALNAELVADNERLRRVLEIIAGQSTDKLQATQARSALSNIGPATGGKE